MSTTPEPVEPAVPADAEEETSPATPQAAAPAEPSADQLQPEPPEAAEQAAAPAEPSADQLQPEPPEAAEQPAAPAEPSADQLQPEPPEAAEQPAEAATEQPAEAASQQPEAPAEPTVAELQAEAAQAEPPSAAQPEVPAEPTVAELQPAGPAEAEAEGAQRAEASADGTEAAPAAGEAEGAGEGKSAAQPGEGGKRRKKRKKGKGEAHAADQAAAPPADEPAEQPKKRRGPEPSEVTARIGTTNERALAYLADPDPKLSRLSRKVTEALLPDLHPVTGAALLGPAGFTRHLVASAATGRYRDLFVLWETFRRFPAEAKPELAERSVALAKAQEKLRTAVRIGLTGRSARLAEDVQQAEGLIWTWLREALVAHLPAVGARPAVASALLRRDPGIDVPLPEHPDERWLAEAASARQHGPLADPVEALLGANVHRLPATVDTLRLATVHYPERVAALVDRVDLDAPDIGAFLAWARDHGAADRLHGRIRDRVAAAAARDRQDGLRRWYAWRQRGVLLELPDALRTDSLEGFDLSRPETAELAARLEARGVHLDLQQRLEDMAHKNRQLAEKAYEAMVCAGLDVTLPESLKGNPVVNPGTRCPKCQAWTWVRPGHEARCPRPEAPTPEPEPDPFDFVAAEAGASDQA
jgi:hypothetical protein